MLYNKAKIQRLLLLFSTWLLSWGVVAQPLTAEPVKSPSVVVVLAGGGAKGFAHLAVLRRLEQDHG
jgi:NTE family protein